MRIVMMTWPSSEPGRTKRQGADALPYSPISLPPSRDIKLAR